MVVLPLKGSRDGRRLNYQSGSVPTLKALRQLEKGGHELARLALVICSKIWQELRFHWSRKVQQFWHQAEIGIASVWEVKQAIDLMILHVRGFHPELTSSEYQC